MPDLPVRGPAVRSLDLPLPPARMPPLRRGRPLKRWRYVGVFGPELILCVGAARVAGVPRRWWAVALPDGSLFEGTRGVVLDRGSRVRAGDGAIDFELEEQDAIGVGSADERAIAVVSSRGQAIEVVSRHGRAFAWTRKQAGVPVRARVRVGGREWRLDGPLGFVDDSAGYHARHTAWRWSAGIGRLRDGTRVAWNLVDGLHDAPRASERTVWVDGEPREVPAQPFAADLSRVGELRFSAWCTRAERVNRLLVRSDYRQPFGSFSGALPGGLELESGYGVMEWHDVRW